MSDRIRAEADQPTTAPGSDDFTAGESVMLVLGYSYELRDVPAEFVCMAGICSDGNLRARVKLNDGSVQEMEARRLYRPVGGALPRHGHASASNSASVGK